MKHTTVRNKENHSFNLLVEIATEKLREYEIAKNEGKELYKKHLGGKSKRFTIINGTIYKHEDNTGHKELVLIKLKGKQLQ